METETKQAITWLSLIAVATLCFGPIGGVVAAIACNESNK